MSVDNYYVKVDGKWRQTEDEADFTDYWVDAEEPGFDTHSGKLIGFLDCRYFFPDFASAYSYLLDRTVGETDQAKKPKRMSIHNYDRDGTVYEQRPGVEKTEDNPLGNPFHDEFRSAGKCECYWPCIAGEPESPLHHFFHQCPMYAVGTWTRADGTSVELCQACYDAEPAKIGGKWTPYLKEVCVGWR